MTFKLSKLPGPIRVGAHDVGFSHLSDSESDDTFGMFRPSEMRIELAKDYSAGSVAVDTAIHEVTHALLFAGGVKDDLQEQVCIIIGNGFAQLFRDNPDFIRWLQQTVNR